ncbi:hypothetical protein QJS10_CPA07g00829 [Acorus calamus]|uniref:CRM domain-containing protein n=1 Tax=Acorus calamus TaxID=4465 RepID=A0AAV9EEF0_ACOCL|nr:hypothetical protein QJS10_CPA07g00829 [Acorus calamus]
MALRAASPFTFFPPTPHPPPSLRCRRRRWGPTEIRMSRWGNANAEPFVRRQREQKAIEDEIRLHRRHSAASRIVEDASAATAAAATPLDFRSVGTPSSPSSPSIPGKKSKYSKNPTNPNNRNAPPDHHPAFRPIRRGLKSGESDGQESGISVSDMGVSYKIPDAPFEFQYSYTETPKVRPLALREPPFLPFGPDTMPRPWTGRRPLPGSKKKLAEFDSFKLPPPFKKGVKPVQAPGPYLEGSGGPRHAVSREEVLGEPLTEEEVKELIKGCLKTTRQLNMGRDGLTHNMLDNIHAHWKRRRVCKIKCKGVCTVDMDNVRQQLEHRKVLGIPQKSGWTSSPEEYQNLREALILGLHVWQEKTGGKIVYSRGGVIFLFRGRNYNYRTRPRFPLMLWKPVAPVYPRLVQRVPEGLTLEEATELRKRGRLVPPICKLGKNGVYVDLVNNVKEAFEECELVRINCQGMNKSDCRKIGAKLKDLVPCVLISFEYEYILMWRGRDWVSSLPKLEADNKEPVELVIDVAATDTLSTVDLSSVRPKETEYTSMIKSSNEMISLEKEIEDNTISKEKTLHEVHDDGIRSGSDDMIDSHESDIISDLGNTGSEGPNLSLSRMGENARSGTSLSPAPHIKQTMLEENMSGSATISELITVNNLDELKVPSPSPLNSSIQEMEGLSHTEINDSLLPASDSELKETTNNGSSSTVDITGNKNEFLSENPAGSASCSASALNKALPTESILAQNVTTISRPCTDWIIQLLRQAIDSGSAIRLDELPLDADIVFQRSIALAKTAPPGPVFRQRIRKFVVKKSEKYKKEKREESDVQVGEVAIVSERRSSSEKRSSRNRRKDDLGEVFHDVVPHGNLRVDELAKLLA